MIYVVVSVVVFATGNQGKRKKKKDQCNLLLFFCRKTVLIYAYIPVSCCVIFLFFPQPYSVAVEANDAVRPTLFGPKGIYLNINITSAILSDKL